MMGFMKLLSGAAITCLAVAGLVLAADGIHPVVIYNNAATEVIAAPQSLKGLWVTTTDLKRATRFEIKPQGVCRDELCFPLPKGRKDEFVSKAGSTTWFNLGEFSKMLKQPVAYDEKNSAWFIGPMPTSQNEHLQTLDAPNFFLPDMNGKMHSLADFRGKKVMLITWASW
jgi:hypothetical protein